MFKFLVYFVVASIVASLFGPIGLLVCLGLMFMGGDK